MIRTGIGGWVYPDWRKGNFYPEGVTQKRELEYASRQLGAIEINGTYHSLQKPESFRKWREATPEGFVFAVKGSSYVTVRGFRFTQIKDRIHGLGFAGQAARFPVPAPLTKS